MRQFLLFSILAAGLFVFSACGPMLPVVDGFSTRWKFYDIEIPDSCNYIERESWTYVEPGWTAFRVGEGTFVGETRRDVVTYRYTQTMPKRGYQLVSSNNNEETEKTQLQFYHPVRNEVVDIEILRGAENLIYVNVKVIPK